MDAGGARPSHPSKYLKYLAFHQVIMAIPKSSEITHKSLETISNPISWRLTSPAKGVQGLLPPNLITKRTKHPEVSKLPPTMRGRVRIPNGGSLADAIDQFMKFCYLIALLSLLKGVSLMCV